MSRYAACVDVGSTWTKVAVVDLAGGRLVATAGHRTTADTDVLHGLDAAVAQAARGLPDYELFVCSSAGGGLRLAVVGYERLVTAEAGHRVGLSAGARVVHVAAGPLDGGGVPALRAARPDVVLLVGGTDGGDAEVLLHNAARLAAARLRVPVVLAGNADAADAAEAALAARGVPVTVAPNVLPAIGVLAPGPARAAIRDVFLRHVIGGKRLSRGARFAGLVRAATPDAVLTGVELLADGGAAGDLLVVDIGGATTDVYSVLTPDPEREAGPRREVAGTLWRSRTVEGDLGMRWSAPGVIEAARAERLPADDALAVAAARRAADPGLIAAAVGAGPVGVGGSQPGDSGWPLGGSDGGALDVDGGALRRAAGGVAGGVLGSAGASALDDDLRIAGLAATVALRRHARGEAPAPGLPRRGGRDLRDVRLVIGSGGVLRHAPARRATEVLAAALHDDAGGWPLPRAATTVIDRDYILAAAGLLAADHPAAALALLKDRLHARPHR
ncbi:glutamate mutase L [Rhizomonospora bruguierae]|uniref:glutamate mutase L n=1 Tax=Rhizomonospora bruguierae TaxID=1581705 RepID=UPI0020BE68D6|nr:glutamate mutase L [Micromonospora sp. NBRC 107566]